MDENEPDKIKLYDKDNAASKIRLVPIAESVDEKPPVAAKSTEDTPTPVVEYTIQHDDTSPSKAFLPEFTLLGPLELLKMYESKLSLPVALCRNKAMQYYWAVRSQTNTKSEIWHFAAISKHRLQHVTSGEIDLRTVFMGPENQELIHSTFAET